MSYLIEYSVVSTAHYNISARSPRGRKFLQQTVEDIEQETAQELNFSIEIISTS